jgi:lysophospholipase L1-like esterase
MKRKASARALLPLGLTVLVTLALVAVSGCTVWRIRQAGALASHSEVFEQNLAQGAAPGVSGRGRLLMVGDSTGVGTGATSPAASVAGLIGRDHPDLVVVNRAADGARFSDMLRQLEGAADFDVILVLGGGNDVIRLTDRGLMASGIARLVAAAQERAPVVLLMPPGNVGNVPFFFPPWSWLMTQRSRELHALVKSAAASSGALYVNTFAERADDPFAQEPERYNAVDGLHPSDAGYQLWYEALNRQAGLKQRLQALNPAPSRAQPAKP